jgi:hypothetical protein
MAGSDRTARDLTLARLLAVGLTQTAAAERAGMSDRTVRRRLADPAFAQLVDGERLRIAERTLDQLMFGAERATRNLLEIADGTVTVVDTDGQEHPEAVPVSVRVSAARALLAAAVNWRDQVELDRRLTAIETAIAARSGPRAVR